MKIALHSVSYAGTWAEDTLSLEETIDRTADLGYAGILLMAKRGHASVLDLGPSQRERLRAQLERRGLEVAGMAAYTDFTVGGDRPDVPLSEMQVLYVDECARLAADLGSGVVRVFTGYERPDLAPSQAWARCVDAIRECGVRAAEHGVVIAVQNHHDVANHHEALRDFVLEVGLPNVKLGFDAWAPALHGLDSKSLESAARELAPLTVQTIVADYVLRRRFRFERDLNSYREEPPSTVAVPIGEGFIDYESFLRGLFSGGFDGYVIYEMCSPLRGGGSLDNLDRHARRFVEWAAATHTGS
jgi:sugar phosphate isomerase/epimerase